MKKFLMLMLIFFCFFFFGACAGSDQSDTSPQPQLIFNPVEVTSILSITLPPFDVPLPLTNEQIRALFPGLESDVFVDTYYVEGVLEGITGVLRDEGIGISIGIDRFFDWFDYDFGQGPHQSSNVHGVEVAAFLVESGMDGRSSLQVDFSMDNLVYRLRLRHTDAEAEQALLAEVVEQIILGGSADLSVLDSVVPER